MVVGCWIDKLMYWAFLLLVAIMLPVSCIIHCHRNSPDHSVLRGLFVCHPLDTLQHQHSAQVHAHGVPLRATHEVALLFLALLPILMRFVVVTHAQPRLLEWIPPLHTPPPRRCAFYSVNISQ